LLFYVRGEFKIIGLVAILLNQPKFAPTHPFIQTLKITRGVDSMVIFAGTSGRQSIEDNLPCFIGHS
jgi:hypothetical protein